MAYDVLRTTYGVRSVVTQSTMRRCLVQNADESSKNTWSEPEDSESDVVIRSESRTSIQPQPGSSARTSRKRKSQDCDDDWFPCFFRLNVSSIRLFHIKMINLCLKYGRSEYWIYEWKKIKTANVYVIGWKDHQVWNIKSRGASSGVGKELWRSPQIRHISLPSLLNISCHFILLTWYYGTCGTIVLNQTAPQKFLLRVFFRSLMTTDKSATHSKNSPFGFFLSVEIFIILDS